MTSVISASGKPSAVSANSAYTAPDEPSDQVPSCVCFAVFTIVPTADSAADAPVDVNATAVEEAPARTAELVGAAAACS